MARRIPLRSLITMSAVPAMVSGAQPGSVRDCPTCKGTGEIRRIQRSGNQSGMNIAQCPECGGSGRIIGKPCETCHGKGSIRKTRRIEVSIPAGVEDGQFLRIAGEGEPGEDHGPPGDLYAVVHIKKHAGVRQTGGGPVQHSRCRAGNCPSGR